MSPRPASRKSERSGRRRGESQSRLAILAAAREQFAEHGYERATIRSIAGSAGVDPALVIYFYGSKEQLFLASIEVAINPAEAVPKLLEPGLDRLGERLTRFYLGLWETPETRGAVGGLLRSAFSHDEAATLLRAFLGREVFGRIAPYLEGPDPELRVGLVGSQLVGLAVARYIVKVEPLASATEDTVVAWVAPTIQRYVNGNR